MSLAYRRDLHDLTTLAGVRNPILHLLRCYCRLKVSKIGKVLHNIVHFRHRRITPDYSQKSY